MPSPFPQLPPDQRGTVHWLRHDADVLRDNPWNDPSERDLIVYTPPGWSGESLPAVMCLVGFSGTGEKLLNRGMNTISIANRIDRLIAAGCPPFAAVLPDCMTRLGGSQYLDSPGIGAYGTYVADALTQAVRDQLGIRGPWGVMGHSSGGFGALHLVMNHPGRFQAAASHAGDMGFDLCYLGDLGKALTGVGQLGGLTAFLDAFWSEHNPSGAAFAAINILCMSCAYSPEPGREPFPARFPIDFDTGAVDFEVLAEWRRYDPIVQLREPEKAEALRALKCLFIDAGASDEHGLQYGARRFSRALARAGIAHEHEEFPGRHGGTRYRFDVSLRKLADALTTP